jgi:SAM-dependent methyltransferase
MPNPPPVSAQTYNADYYLSECDGFDQFARGAGELPPRLEKVIALAGDLAGLRVADLGCGRGELVRYARDRGARLALGLDYSAAGLALAKTHLTPHSAALRCEERGQPPLSTGAWRGGGRGEAAILQADAQRLPVADGALDLILALDLVEHLHPAELDRALAECFRALAPGGRLLIHTMPNLWYYRYGYPLYRLAMRLRGARLPADPRDRYRYVRYVHVNEQTAPKLARSLRRAGFRARVRLRNLQDFANEPSAAVRAVNRFLVNVYPLAWIFCNDIVAIAIKS